jgi:hypothetical protein
MSGEGLLPNDPDAGLRIHVSRLAANSITQKRLQPPSLVVNIIPEGTVIVRRPRWLEQ